jgi:hypothetical protein
MRLRTARESNYRAIFGSNYKTVRWRIDKDLPITKLRYPEVVDVSLGTLCFGGCPYCYTSATHLGSNYQDVVRKIFEYWSVIPDEHRPFQVALGGGGEPTLHPEFVDVLAQLRELGIVPNYTTNGMHLSRSILDATIKYCGGVAVTAHRHLNWERAVTKLHDAGVSEINIHVVVGWPGSAEFAREARNKFDFVSHVVLLPYQVAGFASPIDEIVRYAEMYSALQLMLDNGYAIGALYSDFLRDNPQAHEGMNLSLYNHEDYSGYLMLDDDPKMRVSSYDLRLRGE